MRLSLLFYHSRRYVCSYLCLPKKIGTYIQWTLRLLSRTRICRNLFSWDNLTDFMMTLRPQDVYRLNNALYSLIQASRLWTAKTNFFFEDELELHSCRTILASTLGEKYGYNHDSSIRGWCASWQVFIRYRPNYQIRTQWKFSEQNVKGDSKICLRLERSRNRSDLFLTIKQYVLARKVLECFNMLVSMPFSNLIEHVPSEADIATDLFDSWTYRQENGSLMYFKISVRPYIAFSVAELCQYMKKGDRNCLDVDETHVFILADLAFLLFPLNPRQWTTNIMLDLLARIIMAVKN